MPYPSLAGTGRCVLTWTASHGKTSPVLHDERADSYYTLRKVGYVRESERETGLIRKKKTDAAE